MPFSASRNFVIDLCLRANEFATDLARHIHENLAAVFWLGIILVIEGALALLLFAGPMIIFDYFASLRRWETIAWLVGLADCYYWRVRGDLVCTFIMPGGD